MTDSKSPGILKQAGACLLIAVLVSCLIGLALALSGSEEFTLFETLKIAAGTAVFAFMFVATGILIIGLPALLIARRMGLVRGMWHLGAIGAAIGAVAAPLVFMLPFPNIWDGLGYLVVTGALSGLIAALIWWHLIEKHKLMENTNV